VTDPKTKSESPDEVHVEISYDGPAIKRGRMPVETLAPAMLGMADLLGATASTIYSDDIRLNIDVVADFREGSFGFELAVAQTLQPETLDYGVNLIQVVGVVLGSGGVIEVVKWLKNRRIERTEPRDDKSVTIVTIDGDKNTVKLSVPQLLESPRIRHHIGRVIKPLKSIGITSFDASSEKVGETHIEKDDLGAFEIPDDDTDIISDHATNQVVRIAMAPLESPEHKWQFAQGEVHFWAHITDEGFLERCERHRIRFGTGDSLSIELRTVTMGDPRDPRYEREVTKVYRILRADKPVQGNIFDNVS